MTILSFTIVVALISSLAGFLGAITGLGGGVIVVPALALLLGIDIRYAIGASLVSVIATSSGAAATYVREGIPNIRIGLFLEIATTLGALGGAFLATRVSSAMIALLFGGVLLNAGIQALRTAEDGQQRAGRPDPLGARLRLNGEYVTHGARHRYEVERVPQGFGLMVGAGMLSGMLGVGSGALKVLAMDRMMKIPFKVSTTTSNFMIGVTGAASAGIYLSRGYIEPAIAMPVMIGVLGGAFWGSRYLVRADVRFLRKLFGVLICLVGVEMIYNALTGGL
jgi:uncharacterized protein